MIDHIISQDFKDCNKMVEYADKLYARRRGNTVADVNANHKSVINAIPSSPASSALLVPTTLEVTNDKQFQFSHTFSQDLDYMSLDNNDQVFS
jgi:hypothetical protein